MEGLTVILYTRLVQFLQLTSRGCPSPGPDGQRGLCSGVSWDCGNWGGMVLGRLPSSGDYADSRPRHTPHSFCEGGHSACPGAFNWVAGLKPGTHLVAYGAALNNAGCRHHLGALSLPCSSSPVSPKKVYTLIWTVYPDFCNCCPGDRSCGSGGQQGLHLWPPRTEYICILIKLLPEGLASSPTESRCWNPPLWDTVYSWRILNYWELLIT